MKLKKWIFVTFITLKRDRKGQFFADAFIFLNIKPTDRVNVYIERSRKRP